jgi:predicted MFS family arabinose efflux permease
VQEWRKGWPVVLGAAIGYGTGGGMVLLLASLFVQPMREELGWSAAAVTMSPIVTLTWALCYPATGAVIDRFGSRSIALIGTLGLAFCASLMAVLPISKVSFYAMAALIGVCASMTAVPTYTRGVATWFRQGVGLAFGIALSGSAIVAIGATPLTGGIIAEYGWRGGFLSIAGIALLIGLPLIALLYRERSEAPAPDADFSAPNASGALLGEALRDVLFWFYLLSFTSACVALGGTLAHLQALLAERGFPLAEALSFGVLYALSMTFGKVAGGILLDRLWPFAVAAGITTLAALGSFGLATMDATSSYILVGLLLAVVGMAQGAESDFVAYFTLRSFGMRAFSTIVGGLAMIVTLGLSTGAWMYGMLFDAYGGYETAFMAGGAFLLAAGIFILGAGILERARYRGLSGNELQG